MTLPGGPRTEASAQVVAICETALGPRTTSQITAELEQAGYPGPWDLPAQIEAYARASGGPATCGGSSRSGRATTVVLLVAGYGSDLTSASVVFSALQSELLARDPTTSFAFFSYRGSDVRGCASVPTPYSPADTAQSLDASVAVFLTTLQALQSACPADIAVVGHSLGGLIAFHALGRASERAGQVRDDGR